MTARLDHMRDLGATVVWLMPIHPIGAEKRKGTLGSPYSIRDFHAVNPDYGTPEDLKRLVREAHARGLRVILDVVANHTSWDSVMMETPELYVRDAQGRVQPPNADWTDVAKLDYANPKTRAYVIEMMADWLRELRRRRLPLRRGRPRPDRLLGGGAAAARGDPPRPLPARRVEHARPDDEGVRRRLRLALPRGAQPRPLARRAGLARSAPTWEEEQRTFPQGSLHLRFSDNHDEKRAIARFGEPAALAAQALVFTMDGIPLVYNGMEVGDTSESGGPALTERLPIFWPIVERRPEFPRVLPGDDRAAPRARGAAPRRDAVGAVLRPRARRLLPPARRGRGACWSPSTSRASRGPARVELPAGGAVRRDHAGGAPAAAAGRRRARAPARTVALPALGPRRLGLPGLPAGTA